MPLRSTRLVCAGVLTLTVPASLAACGTESTGSSSGAVTVVAGDYPLEFAAKQVGGDHVDVSDLTKPGAEPHEVELTPKEVGRVTDADLVVYSQGMSPSVDSAAKNEAQGHAFDVNDDARLTLHYTSAAAGEESDDHEHEEGEGEHEHETEAGTRDPHFWLDPVRYASVAQGLADRLSKQDPEHRSDYQRNAARFTKRLKTLSNQLTTGLADCRQKNLVTSHAAFGYLAQRTGMKQVPIAGLSPDQEPSASALASISSYAKQHDVSTIYTETLASPALAKTVARNTGARTAVLDPVEGVTDESAGNDYFQIMRANLKALQKGQSCS